MIVYADKQLASDKRYIIRVLRQLIPNNAQLDEYIKRINEAPNINKADEIRKEAINELLV